MPNAIDYRYKKTSEDDKTITPKTFNNHHGYLSAMYNKLRKLKVIDYDTPIKDIDFIKVQERQLSYFSRKQIDVMLQAIDDGCKNKSTWHVTQICLRTGCRWSEAEQLKLKQLHSGMITFEFTKSKRTRSIPLEQVFYKKLMQFARHKNPNDRVFDNCMGSFRRAIYRTDLELPKGQMTHILRHSFASHFVMNGGNILSLQKILGHADIAMTMRYAHLAPDHLKDAVLLNPIA
jgi:integrase